MSEGTASGSLLILLLYDVGDSIALDQLRRTLGAPPARREPPFRQPAPDYVRFIKPPVIEPVAAFSVGGQTEISGRVAYYEYGIVSILLELPFDGPWPDVVSMAARWMNSPELEERAVAVVREHVRRAGKAVMNPYSEWLNEDYRIVHVRHAQDAQGHVLSAQELIDQHPAEIAQLVRGEVARFSSSEQAEILESRMSYYENDLLVVGWSAALVYDTPEGAESTVQLLEYANTLLLEFRHYDGVLTGLLSKVYRSLDRSGPLARWRLARDAERLSKIRIDIRELIERLDNSIKFLSDIFAARLYRMAAMKIGVPDYRLLVDQKLESAGELYGLMMDRFYQGRAFVLEVLVVIILLIELGFLFRGVK